MMRSALMALVILGLIGSLIWMSSGFSRLGTPPNPNDPRQAAILTPEVLRRILKGDSDALLERMPKDSRGRVNDADFKNYMAQATNTLLDQVNMERMPPSKAWEYGEIYITAERWQDAKKAEEIAVKVAKDEDRRINDSLRLARVLAELNELPDAVKTARSTFNVSDTGAAPILLATLLEIVPAGEGKGHDAELAALLEDAITCEMRTIVDPKSQPGQDFLMARPHHVEHAWNKVVELYERAGKPDEADRAHRRALQMESARGSA